METIERDFPLFPLGLVGVPPAIVPLHIFEDRYKTMVAECVAGASEFGIVWLSDDGLRPVGCACEITEVLDRMEDGGMNILTRGTRPFRVPARHDALAHPDGEVEFLEDRDEAVNDNTLETAHTTYADLVEQATDNRPD